MKKRLFKLAILLMTTVALIFVLASCGDEEEEKTPEQQAMEAFTLIEEKMDSLSGYRFVSESTARLFSSSTYSEVFQSIEAVYYGVGTDEFSSTQVSTVETYEVGSDDKDVMTVREGFFDDSMYLSVEFSTGYKRQMKSTMTAEEYRSFSSDESILPAEIENISDFTEIKCNAQTDGGWFLSFKASGDDAPAFAEVFFGASAMYTVYELAHVTGVTLTIEADSEYRAERMTAYIDFVSNDGEDDMLIPYYFTEVNFTDYETAEPVDVDLTEYKQVDDLRAIVKINRAIENTYALDGGSAELVYDYYTKDGSTHILTQNTSISYSVSKDYKMSFRMESVAEDETTVITYEDGWMYTDGEKEQTNNLVAAKNIFSCFDPTGFSTLSVTDIQTIDANGGVYRFTDSGLEVTITIKDGTVARIEYSTTKYVSGVNLKINCVCTLAR